MNRPFPSDARAPAPGALRRRVLRAARAEPNPGARAEPNPAARAEPNPGARAAPKRRRRRHQPRAPGAGWLALALAGVAAVVAVQLQFTPPAERTISATLGRAQLRLREGRGDLFVDHLPPLGANRTYELWLVTVRRGPIPSTLFGVTSGGSARLGVPGGLERVRSLLVTIAPRVGSLVPPPAQ